MQSKKIELIDSFMGKEIDKETLVQRYIVFFWKNKYLP